MRGPTRKPARDTVDSLLGPLAATTLLLGVLLLWARTYEQSCLALASPGLVYIAVFWGLLEYRLERRRFAIDYYLDGTSPWRRLFRRSWLPAATSMIAAVPLAVFLSVFAALAHAAVWLILAGASVLAPLLFNRLSVWPGRHFRRAAGGGILGAPAEILTSRMAGHLLLALVVIAYVYSNYSTIAGPANIYPGSPELTVKTSVAQIHSACPVVQTGLRAAAAYDGAAWWGVTGAAIAPRTPEGIVMIAWAALFLNAALAMTGFVRGLEGTLLLTRRVAPRTRATDGGDGGAATNPTRWAPGIRRVTLLLVPLTVLAAIGHHALQQRAAERWSADIRTGDFPEIRRAIDERVDSAFAPAYMVIPELVDRHVSPSGIVDQLIPFLGEDKRLVTELQRTVSRARETAAEGFYRELHEEGFAQLERLIDRDVGALPSWLRSAYEWVLAPVLDRAKRRLADAVGDDPRGILSEIERAAETADYTTRFSAFWRWFGSSIRGSDLYKEAVRQDVTAVVDWEKDRTKDQLSRAVETVMFTPLGDFVPSQLQPANR